MSLKIVNIYTILFSTVFVLRNTVINGYEFDEQGTVSRCNPNAGSVHQFSVQNLQNVNESLGKYQGSPLIIVNVATYCSKLNFEFRFLTIS